MTTRLFTPEQLEEFDVPYTTLHDEQIDSRRWADTRSCVFRAPDDGKTYEVTYQVPATEHQECDTWFDEKQIKAVEVEQRPVVVQEWKPVGSPLARLQDAVTAAKEDAPHAAMQAAKRVYELCREHDARTGLVPVHEVLNALGLDEEGDPAAEQPAEEQHSRCGKCKQPLDPAKPRTFRAHEPETAYCRPCVDRCHDTEIADHRCVICA